MRTPAPPASGLDACPRCEAGVEIGQEYCVECGARLPLPRGVLPALAGAWRTRVPWYPGDWIWTALGLLVVAAAGATAAVAATEDAEPRALPLVATFDRPVPVEERRRQATSTPAPAERDTPASARERTTGRRTSRPITLVQWPIGQTAYTVVLASLPADGGIAAARAQARRAGRAGLRQVGVLESSRHASLHPGYYVVFSGVYDSLEDAQAAVPNAVSSGYRYAYARRVTS